MRLPAPRVIAIDDEQTHLDGLTQALNRYGTACLPVHFTGEAAIASCSHVRVIFADLHLVGGPPGDHAQDFGMIGGLIEDTIQPTGPYFIVLWTRYPDQAAALHNYLVKGLRNVTKPFAVQALDKNDHLDPQGNVRSPEKLVGAIGQVVAEQPQIGALLNWEERVLSAAGDTVSSITDMAESATGSTETREEVGRLLASLAVGTVGMAHVDEDRFRAVNDALLPILADRIASMRSREADDDLWQTALGLTDAKGQLNLDEAAKLNRLLHIEYSTPDGGERGAVITLPEDFLGEEFGERFDITAEDAAEKQFLCKRSQVKDNPHCWVLVQTQAACDYAQNQPGPLPFHLGLTVPASETRKGSRPPAALWRSPCFEYKDQASVLHVNARFQVSLSREKTRQAEPLFRLREQLLGDLIYTLHGYSARPGIVSFSGTR